MKVFFLATSYNTQSS